MIELVACFLWAWTNLDGDDEYFLHIMITKFEGCLHDFNQPNPFLGSVQGPEINYHMETQNPEAFPRLLVQEKGTATPTRCIEERNFLCRFLQEVDGSRHWAYFGSTGIGEVTAALEL